ncbi:MAG: hypothetical protein JSV03_13660, partial [Planctomycetota bacterium]
MMKSKRMSNMVLGLLCFGLSTSMAYGINPIRPLKGQIRVEGEKFVDDNGPIQLVGYSCYKEFTCKGEACQSPSVYIEKLAGKGFNLARVFIDHTFDNKDWSSIQTVKVKGPHAQLT